MLLKKKKLLSGKETLEEKEPFILYQKPIPLLRPNKKYNDLFCNQDF